MLRYCWAVGMTRIFSLLAGSSIRARLVGRSDGEMMRAPMFMLGRGLNGFGARPGGVAVFMSCSESLGAVLKVGADVPMTVCMFRFVCGVGVEGARPGAGGPLVEGSVSLGSFSIFGAGCCWLVLAVLLLASAVSESSLVRSIACLELRTDDVWRRFFLFPATSPDA